MRSADGTLRSVAGSALMSLLDACKGFNQVVNTRRAMEMLAILARSGQYLPRCLTFGPHNGPEDFAFATDRVFAPGRNRKMRFCQQWQIYADDITVRTGRVLDGVIYSDEEYANRVSDAKEREVFKIQPLEESFRHLGFQPEGLGQEDKKIVREKTKKEKNKEGKGKESASDPSPYAHESHGRLRGSHGQGVLWSLLRILVIASVSSSFSCGLDAAQRCPYTARASRRGHGA